MTRTFKSLVIALSGAGFLATGAVEAQACHGRHRGGGYRGQVVVVRAPQYQYAQQAYQPQMAYPQQQVQQVPQFSQPGVVQGQNGAVGVQFQNTQAQGGQFQGAPATGNATASAISALGGDVGGFAQGQGQGQVAATGTQQTVFGQQTQVNQQAQFSQQSQVGGQTQFQSAPATSNFAGNGAAQGQVQQTQFQQPAQQQAQPQIQSQAQSQSQATQRNAQTMALEALSGLDSGDAVPAATQASAQSAQPGLTGNFAATLSTVGATIRLQLNNDGSFNWTVATKDGKTSNFQGSYSVNGQLLTLARTDSRKLEASLTPTASGFALRMIGQNASTLSFVRV
jgi:hypothetical protein